MQSKFWLARKTWTPGGCQHWVRQVPPDTTFMRVSEFPHWESTRFCALGALERLYTNEVTKNSSEHAYCWRRKWQPALEFLPWKSRGGRILVGAVHGVAGSQTWLSDWERPLLVSVPLSHWTIKYKLKDKIFKNCTRWKGAPLVSRGPCVTAQVRCHEADPDTMRTCIWSKSCQQPTLP